MRKIVILMIVFVIVGTTIFSQKNKNPIPQLEILPSVSPTTVENTVQYGEGVYAYEMFRVSNPEHINLIPNFESQASASGLILEYSCKNGLNGGFYGENSLPVGLFEIDDKTYGRQSSSTLVNGFFSVLGNQAKITSMPFSDARISLQSGPLLVTDEKPLKLKLIDDKVSRRSWVGITKTGEVVFSIVYSPQVEILGPRLEDLPEIVGLIAVKENLRLLSAVNLDGGKASFYHSQIKTLPEVTPIGSLFCIR